jgi:hypothetical protein
MDRVLDAHDQGAGHHTAKITWGTPPSSNCPLL